jgi:hypothetical protein
MASKPCARPGVGTDAGIMPNIPRTVKPILHSFFQTMATSATANAEAKERLVLQRAVS